MNMRFLVNYGRTFTILLLLFPFLGVSASYLYLQYEETKKDIVEIVQDNILNKKHELLDIYVKHLRREFGEDFIRVLQNSEKARNQAEKELSLMKNSEVQYLYLLYIDDKNHLRYLLDTTEGINEKGEFKQRFIPQKSIWEKAQQKMLPEVTAQKEIDKLWISMAYPIVIDKKTVALLGIDFSHQEYIKINKTLIPLEHIYLYSAIFIIVMLISAMVQLWIYYTHRKKSFIDPLTGMFNRQYLNELMKKYSIDSFQILLMDLDYFKKVNDLYGHDAGDEVLRTVSRRIQSVIRKDDILIRYGGEEFLLLISSEGREAAVGLAERIRQKVNADPVSLEDCQLNITLSMGLNPFPDRSKNFDQAFKIADQGLYKAKSLGRDRVEVYDEVYEEVNGLQKTYDVKEALALENIYCVFQPIFDTKTLELDKYELLIRMKDTKGNVIKPAQFLPAIRYTQVYIKLVHIVLEQAYEALSNNDIRLSINLDLQDLFDDELLELFLDTFSQDLSLAQRLTVEILEHEERLDLEPISERLAKLWELGIKVAIDDFGSGYASYQYILNMKIDILKIDGSLIENIHENKSAQKIVKSIQTLASELGIETVAEHIETKEQFECVKDLGVNYVQGYYLGRASSDFTDTFLVEQ